MAAVYKGSGARVCDIKKWMSPIAIFETGVVG
jgi:hypothetical protein